MFAAMAAASPALGQTIVPGTHNTPGTYNETIAVDGIDRSFIVHVGRNSAPNSRVPVVFMFHGTSGNGQRFYDISYWRQKADQEGFIAVFPDALTYCFFEDENLDGDFTDQGERHVTTKWASGNLGDPAVMPLCPRAVVNRLPQAAQNLVDHPLMDDLAFVDAMIDDLYGDHLIDRSRIYASGFSNGAQLVGRLLVERSQDFAALAAHAGTLAVPVSPAPRAVPFFLSLGSMDDRVTTVIGAEVPIDDTLVAQFPDLGDVLVYPFADQLELAHSWGHRTRTVGGKVLSTFTFADSLSGRSSAMAFMVVEDNTHAYPNGANHPLVMADLLWRLFEPIAIP